MNKDVEGGFAEMWRMGEQIWRMEEQRYGDRVGRVLRVG